MRILHTEASPGWGGQELRILREAEGMRARGHDIFLAVQKGGGLVKPAREAGFVVYELSFDKKALLSTFWALLRLVVKQRIELLNTHSSLDAWVGGVVARLLRRKVIRTRHLSTPIRAGLNSRLLYNTLADCVVTTCEEVVEVICRQAHLPKSRCHSIPTGVVPVAVDAEARAAFRARWGIAPSDFLVGTLCVLRGWKGVSDFLVAAKKLEHLPHLKWMVVGSGVSEAYFKQQWQELQLQHKVLFTGHLSPPYEALAAMDLFLLLSHANEGVSQASLQAAWLEKPLVTTQVGGLKEVCLPEKTGIHVEVSSPAQVAAAVERLYNAPELCRVFGQNARQLVQDHFLLEHTLDQMEKIYSFTKN